MIKKRQEQRSKDIGVPTGTHRFYEQSKLQSVARIYQEQHADEVVLMPARPLISKKGRQVELAILQQFGPQRQTNRELQRAILDAEDKVQRYIANGMVPSIAIPFTLDIEQLAECILGRSIVGNAHKSDLMCRIIQEQTVDITYKDGRTKKGVKVFGGDLGEYCMQVHPYSLPTKRAGKMVFVECFGKMAEVKSIYYQNSKLMANILIYEGLYAGLVEGSKNLANFKYPEQYVLARGRGCVQGEIPTILENLIAPYRDSEIRKAKAKRQSIYEQASNAKDTATKNRLLAKAQQTRAHRRIREDDIIEQLRGNKTYEVQTTKKGKAYASPRYSLIRKDIQKNFEVMKEGGMITGYTPKPTDQPSKAKEVIYTIYYENVEPTQLIIQEPTIPENATKRAKKTGVNDATL